ncbi:MAG: glycosyltransferase family 2 protein [Rickettsiaceae bacterium]
MTANIAILMCTYNGEKFLQEQLESFANQSFKDWHLFVYDDGSTDNTEDLIKTFKQNHKVSFVSNHLNLGFAKNFLNGIASTDGNFDFYALSDQDDIWLESKLEKALAYLQKIDANIPALYCSRTILVDATGNQIGYSPLFTKKPSFSNALVQSIAGGNTMVFNKAAHDLIIKAGSDINVVSHDWFIYQLIAGAEGFIYYDSSPGLLYRQHGSNIIGANNDFFARLSRLKMLLNNSFRSWNDRNIKILLDNSNILTKDNKSKLNRFIKARESSLFPRVTGFLKCKIYRQTLLGNIALFVGGVLNKI